MIVDLTIATLFFFVEFDTYHALAGDRTSFTYMYISMRMAAWRSPIRRDMTHLDRDAEGIYLEQGFKHFLIKIFFDCSTVAFNLYALAM